MYSCCACQELLYVKIEEAVKQYVSLCQYMSNPFWGDVELNQFSPRHHQSCHALVLRLPGTCTHRGICDDDVDARQRQAAKNVSGFGHAGATGSGQCTCNVPRRKGRGPEMAGQWKTTRKIDKWAIASFKGIDGRVLI